MNSNCYFPYTLVFFFKKKVNLHKIIIFRGQSDCLSLALPYPQNRWTCSKKNAKQVPENPQSCHSALNCPRPQLSKNQRAAESQFLRLRHVKTEPPGYISAYFVSLISYFSTAFAFESFLLQSSQFLPSTEVKALLFGLLSAQNVSP